MELLRGTAPKVKFYGPTPDTEIESVTYSVNGVAPVSGTESPVEGEESAWEVQLPYIGSDTNDIEVVWTFSIGTIEDFFSETFSYEAVTPYLTKQEILAIYPQASATEVVELEASVRHIINAHTGQKFGYDKDKTLTVEAHGESALRLPERLVELKGLSTLSANLDPRSAIIVSDGWYLKKGWSYETTPKDSDSLYWGYSIDDDLEPGEPGYEKQSHGYVIVAPGGAGKPTTWKDDYPFDVTGDWGYKTLPAAVKEAAKLLANDYACAEIAFRDRYLESMKAADWRLQFDSRAWESTGNVRADQLLSDFIIWDWAVI